MELNRIIEIAKFQYKELTGKNLNENIEFVVEDIKVNGTLDVLATHVQGNRYKVTKIDKIKFSLFVFTSNIITDETKRRIIAHEICHLARMVENNMIVNLEYDTHDDRWKWFMEKLGFDNPVAKTVLRFND